MAHRSGSEVKAVRRRGRRWIWTGLALVVAWIIGIGPWPVYRSRRPSERALDRSWPALEAAFAPRHEEPVTPAPLRAGWARQVITPAKPLPLSGYGARRGRPATGVAQDIFVKAVALQAGDRTMVLLGADLLLIPDNIARPVRESLARKQGLPAEAIFFSATHTHAAPNPWRNTAANLFTGGAYDAAYGKQLHLALVSATQAAIGDLAPATIGLGHVDGRDYARNRTGRDHLIDDRLEFMLLQQEEGRSCWVVNVAAHATVLGSAGRYGLKADWPPWRCRPPNCGLHPTGASPRGYPACWGWLRAARFKPSALTS